MGIEKRDAYRFSISWCGRVILSDQSFYRVVVRDVSLGGLAVDFQRVVNVGSVLRVEALAPYHGRIEEIASKSVVAHRTRIVDGSTRLGLRFIDMPKDILATFNNILKDLSVR